MRVKEILKKGKNGLKRLLRMKFNKYLIVLVVGVVIVGFVGDNCVVAHMRNKARINSLKEEIEENRTLTRQNLEQLHALQNDVRAVEQVGRERHFMKRADEDVFVLSDE